MKARVIRWLMIALFVEGFSIATLSEAKVVSGGQHLFLNGSGVHRVFLFNVYEISLFLERKTSHSEEILDSTSKKLIVLRFLRDVNAEQIRKALSDGFLE